LRRTRLHHCSSRQVDLARALRPGARQRRRRERGYRRSRRRPLLTPHDAFDERLPDLPGAVTKGFLQGGSRRSVERRAPSQSPVKTGLKGTPSVAMRGERDRHGHRQRGIELNRGLDRPGEVVLHPHEVAQGRLLEPRGDAGAGRERHGAGRDRHGGQERDAPVREIEGVPVAVVVPDRRLLAKEDVCGDGGARCSPSVL
jgi:hypothetical protein